MKTDHFEQLYRGNYARLYYYAFRFVADEEACRDIVNDVFEQAWKDREQLQEATAVACLYTRTRNRCIDYLRHRQVEQQYATYRQEVLSKSVTSRKITRVWGTIRFIRERRRRLR